MTIMKEKKRNYMWEGITYALRTNVLYTDGTCDAKYCYSVWMRHLRFYYDLKHKVPDTVAEFGPGDTIGIGLMALLCGADKYYAFDFTRFKGMDQVDDIFEQLLDMFRNKTAIPGDDIFPNIEPKLLSYEFPTDIFDEKIFSSLLAEERVESLRNSVKIIKKGGNSKHIKYYAPWWNNRKIKCKCDFVFSQAVFEHVDNWKEAHAMIKSISHNGTVIAHEIDFSCHDCAEEWNGHWKYNCLTWRLVYGTRPYFLNRVPLTLHIREMKKNNIKIKKCLRTYQKSGISRKDICRDLRKINNRDFKTKNAFVLGEVEVQ